MNKYELPLEERSPRNYSTAMLLAIFLGFTGAHRLYLKKLGLGIAMLSTNIVCLLSFIGLLLIGTTATSPEELPDSVVILASIAIISYIGIGISAIIALVDIIMLGMHEFKDRQGLIVMPHVIECSKRSYLVTLILALILGVFGVHRFYAGRYITGVLMLLTLGGFGLWWLIDMVLIAIVRFKDSDELPIAYN